MKDTKTGFFQTKDGSPFEPEVQNYLIKRFIFFAVFFIFTVVVTFLFKELILSLAFAAVSIALCTWWLVSRHNFKNFKYFMVEGSFKEITTTQDDNKKGAFGRNFFMGYGKTEMTITSYSNYFTESEEPEETILIVPVKYNFIAGEGSVIRVYFSEGSVIKQNKNTFYINTPLIVFCEEN